MSSWEDFTPSILKPATYVYKYRHKINEFLVKARVKFKLGVSPHILVLGRGGVGKTVLLDHISDEASSKEWQLPETSSTTELKTAELGEWYKIIAVAPGQNTLERRKAVDNALNTKNNLQGIIYLTDFGYTEIRNEALKEELVQEGLTDIDSIRKKNLDLELEEFDTFLTFLEHAILNERGPKWLIIGVNKIDLYFDHLKDAQRYYDPECNGKFKDRIEKLYSQIGRHKLKVICLPVCSLNEPYSWNNLEVTSKINSSMRSRNYLKAFIDQIGLLLDQK